MVEDRLRHHFDYYLGKTEIVIYSVLAALLAVTAFVTIATAGQILWIGLSHWTVAAQTLRVLNQLLIVLMLVEILHTVRISIRSHVLVTEPFLIVGLIASIRRVLVITLEAATLTKEGAWATEGSSAIFHSSMIELGLLGLLILVLVVSITLLRRYALLAIRRITEESDVPCQRCGQRWVMISTSPTRASRTTPLPSAWRSCSCPLSESTAHPLHPQSS